MHILGRVERCNAARFTAPGDFFRRFRGTNLTILPIMTALPMASAGALLAL
jgi:hypothetical protein